MNPGTPITFAGNNLQTVNILTADIPHESPADADAKVYQISNANDNVIPNITYPVKVFTITGTIVSYGLSNFEQFLDSVRAYFNGKNQNLDIGYAGSTRRYIATATKVNIPRPGGLNYAKFSIEFTCKPFGRDVSTTSILNLTGLTAAARTDSFTFLGSAPYQKPIFTMTYTALTATGAQSVIVGNNNNGQQITITRTWSAGDVLVIDTTLKICTVNGIVVDYTGAFPEFPPGPQSIAYSDSLTTRTYNYAIGYNVLYK